jgi:hypothetical protein
VSEAGGRLLMTTVPPAKLTSISFGPGSRSESSAGARSAGARRRSAGTVPCGSDEGVWEGGCSASDSQVRLQAGADQPDSKRFGDPPKTAGGARPARAGWRLVRRRCTRHLCAGGSPEAIVREIRAFSERAGDGGLGCRWLLRGAQHAGYGRARSGLRDADDSESVALVEGHRSRVGCFKEGGAVIGVDARQTLLE